MATTLNAGTSTTGAAISADTSGTLAIQVGATAGSQVTAMSFAADGTPTFLKAKSLAQIQTFQTGAVATGSTALPFDDTIPQITEGDQFLSLAIIPTNASSTLEIDINMVLASTGSNNMTIALFQDATANALAASQLFVNGTSPSPVSFKHVMTAGTTSSTTFKVRAGATGGTQTLNGSGGARLMGGVMSSRITIKEYLP